MPVTTTTQTLGSQTQTIYAQGTVQVTVAPNGAIELLYRQSENSFGNLASFPPASYKLSDLAACLAAASAAAPSM